jgi:large subunit ribosomal protein L15
LNLGQLKHAKGAVKRKRRLGTGRASGRGGTCGRGTKGLYSRSGGKVHPWFEGGQMPLQRRLPKRGFTKRNRLVYQVVNLKDLERMEPGSPIDAAALAAKGLVKDPSKPVKLLGAGEVKGAYSLKVTAASRTAVDKIQAAGGSLELEKALAKPETQAEAPGTGPEKSGEPEVKS